MFCNEFRALDRPADLQSVLPIQVLCALGGLFMVLVEGALAHWSIFIALRH